MTPKASQKIKLILGKILDGYCLDREENFCLEYSIEGLMRDIQMNQSELSLILEKLEEKEIITNFRESGKDFVITEKTYTIYFPEDFVKKAESYINELSGESNERESPTSHVATNMLYLDQYGNFWHGDKAKFCYKMKEKSQRFILLKYLIENNGYNQTSKLTKLLGKTKTQILRNEVGKINSKIEEYLKITDVIDSKPESGYRINPKYTIIFTK